MMAIGGKKAIPKADLLTACGLLKEISIIGVISDKDFHKIAKNMINTIASSKNIKQLEVIDKLYSLAKEI